MQRYTTMSQDGAASRRSLRAVGSPRRGDRRELALLAVAEELLNENGFAEVSIPELAARAGISRPTFYFYFASKQALLTSLVASMLDELTASLSARLAGTYATPAEAVRSALYAVADLWFDHGTVLSAAVELSASEPAIFDRIAGAASALRAPSGTWLLAGRHIHTRRDAEQLAEILIWMAERNFYVLARNHPTRRRLRRLADRLSDIWTRAAGLPPSESL